MDAIITAGGLLSVGDPLYELTGFEKKALIPLADRPMISWVIDALIDSSLVEHIVIVGLNPEEIPLSNFPIHFVDSTGNLINNILAGLDELLTVNPAADKFLLCSSDIPLITPEIIRGFVAECGSQEADVYYALVEEKTMEARFPNSKRSYVPFKGGRYSGGDLFLVSVETPDKTDIELFQALTGSRKNYWQQLRLLDFGFIIRFLFRRMTVHDAAARVSRIVNLDARTVVTRFAELGMDLDKPHQYEIIKADLEKREMPAGHPKSF